MSLARSVIGVLADNDDFDLRQRREIQSSEYSLAAGIDNLSRAFLCLQETPQLVHVGLGELIVQNRLPRIFEFEPILSHHAAS